PSDVYTLAPAGELEAVVRPHAWLEGRIEGRIVGVLILLPLWIKSIPSTSQQACKLCIPAPKRVQHVFHGITAANYRARFAASRTGFADRRRQSPRVGVKGGRRDEPRAECARAVSAEVP